MTGGVLWSALTTVLWLTVLPGMSSSSVANSSTHTYSICATNTSMSHVLRDVSVSLHNSG